MPLGLPGPAGRGRPGIKGMHHSKRFFFEKYKPKIDWNKIRMQTMNLHKTISVNSKMSSIHQIIRIKYDENVWVNLMKNSVKKFAAHSFVLIVCFFIYILVFRRSWRWWFSRTTGKKPLMRIRWKESILLINKSILWEHIHNVFKWNSIDVLFCRVKEVCYCFYWAFDTAVVLLCMKLSTIYLCSVQVKTVQEEKMVGMVHLAFK